MFRILAFIPLVFTLLSCNKCREKCENGICIEKSCSCNQWYEGDACERLKLTQYQGDYLFHQDCNGVESEFPISIESGISPNQLKTSDGLVFNFITISRFNIETQEWRSETVEGEGEMFVNSLSINLKKIDSVQSTVCLLQGTLKQD